MRDLHTRIRAAFERVAVDPDILEELTQHAEATDAALRADGASEPEAIEKIDQLIEGWRRDPQSLRRVSKRAPVVIPPASSSAFASGAWADAIYGWRLLRSRPGYTAIAILTIALGVGAVTTLFSVAYGVLLRPRLVPRLERHAADDRTHRRVERRHCHADRFRRCDPHQRGIDHAEPV